MRNFHKQYKAPTIEQIRSAFSILEKRQTKRRRRGLDGSMMSRLDWRIRENKLREKLFK